MVEVPEHRRLVRLVRQALSEMEEIVGRTWGESFFLRARAHFPGDGPEESPLRERAFLPWSLFRWRPRQAEGAVLPEGAADDRLDAVEFVLRTRERELDAPLADFLRLARISPFRFFVVAGEEDGRPLLLDSLSPRDLRCAWPEEWARPPAHAVVFGQAVATNGLAVFTHEPVMTDLCVAPPENLLPFLRHLSMAVKALRNEGPEAEIIVETALFRQAAAHQRAAPPRDCGQAAEDGGVGIHVLEFDWPEGTLPEMEGLAPHAPWVRITNAGKVLKLEAPGFLPMFAAFRHLLFTVPETPLPRAVRLIGR